MTARYRPAAATIRTSPLPSVGPAPTAATLRTADRAAKPGQCGADKGCEGPRASTPATGSQWAGRAPSAPAKKPPLACGCRCGRGWGLRLQLHQLMTGSIQRGLQLARVSAAPSVPYSCGQVMPLTHRSGRRTSRSGPSRPARSRRAATRRIETCAARVPRCRAGPRWACSWSIWAWIRVSSACLSTTCASAGCCFPPPTSSSVPCPPGGPARPGCTTTRASKSRGGTQRTCLRRCPRSGGRCATRHNGAGGRRF